MNHKEMMTALVNRLDRKINQYGVPPNAKNMVQTMWQDDKEIYFAVDLEILGSAYGNDFASDCAGALYPTDCEVMFFTLTRGAYTQVEVLLRVQK